MQLAQFLIFFQKSGSYVELRTHVINFRGENTAGGIRGITKSRIQRLVTNYTLFSTIKKKHNYMVSAAYSDPPNGGSTHRRHAVHAK